MPKKNNFLENMVNCPMFRTVDAAYDELKSMDPNSKISKNCIRNLIKDGKIPTLKSGNKTIFDFTMLLNLLSEGYAEKERGC